MSNAGGQFVKLVLGLPVNDTTSGLKLTRVSAIPASFPSKPSDLISKRIAYKIQFLFELFRAGAKIQEVPISFQIREHGTTKSSWRDIFETVKVVMLLRFSNLLSWKIFTIGIIGLIGLVFQTLVFELIGLRYQLLSASTAALVGGELAILSNFILNDLITFRKTSGSSFWKRIIKFHGVSLGSIAIQWLLIFTTEQFTTNVNYIRAAYFAGIACGFTINYIGYTTFVWKKKKD